MNLWFKSEPELPNFWLPSTPIARSRVIDTDAGISRNQQLTGDGLGTFAVDRPSRAVSTTGLTTQPNCYTQVVRAASKGCNVRCSLIR